MSETHAEANHLPRGTFAAGQADPEHHREEAHVGAFSDGQEHTPDDAEEGRFSEGVEQLGDADPEKHHEGRFSDTSES
jgi:hypothetical protein